MQLQVEKLHCKQEASNCKQKNSRGLLEKGSFCLAMSKEFALEQETFSRLSIPLSKDYLLLLFLLSIEEDSWNLGIVPSSQRRNSLENSEN